MRISALVLLSLVLSVGGVFAQQGNIGLYSDAPGYSDCNLNETLYASNTIYVVHNLAVTGNTAQFKIVNNWPGPLAGAIDWGTNLTLGDVYTGITVTYVGCKILPYLLGTLSFIPLAPTPPCTATLQVVADPNVVSGSVETVDCDFTVYLSTGSLLIVNAGSDCPCFDATEETDWSRLKALYQ